MQPNHHWVTIVTYCSLLDAIYQNTLKNPLILNPIPRPIAIGKQNKQTETETKEKKRKT